MQRGPRPQGTETPQLGPRESATLRETHLAEAPTSGSLTQAGPLHGGVACVECLKKYLKWFPEFKQWEISY